jgi:hypothetical protein
MIVSTRHILGNGMRSLMCAEDGDISYSHLRATWG